MLFRFQLTFRAKVVVVVVVEAVGSEAALEVALGPVAQVEVARGNGKVLLSCLFFSYTKILGSAAV